MLRHVTKLCIALLLIMVPISHELEAQERTLRVVNVRSNDVLMVREDPSVTGKIVGTIPPDTTGVATTGEVEGRWIFVKFGDFEGWVNSAFVRPDVRRGGPRTKTESPSGERDVNQTARSAWAKAVSLAKQRNAGNICTAEAYQSTILSQLGVAVTLYPPFKDEVLKGGSASAKTLREALAGNIMLYDLIGEISTSEQLARAIIGSVWYSNDGGAMGSNSILHIEKNRVRELVVDPDTSKRNTVIWAYSFDAKTGELALSNGVATRIYKLEKPSAEDKIAAQLTSSDSEKVGYSNEPDDCSA
jgi:hypothetical protein